MRSLFLTGIAALAVLGAVPAPAQDDGSRTVARVGADTVTLAELRAATPPGATGRATQAAVLRGLIGRKLLVQEALREKLDQTPMAAMVIARARESAIAQVLTSTFAGTPPTIGPDRIAAFEAANPQMFGGRRLISLNQLVTDEGGQPLLKKLAPARDMAGFEQTLMRANITYRRAAAVIDTLRLKPEAAGHLAAMKPGDVFITPHGNALELSAVVDNSAAPITGAQADTLARALLMREAVNARIQAQAAAIIQAGQPGVQINEAYAPRR